MLDQNSLKLEEEEDTPSLPSGSAVQPGFPLEWRDKDLPGQYPPQPAPVPITLPVEPTTEDKKRPVVGNKRKAMVLLDTVADNIGAAGMEHGFGGGRKESEVVSQAHSDAVIVNQVAG